MSRLINASDVRKVDMIINSPNSGGQYYKFLLSDGRKVWANFYTKIEKKNKAINIDILEVGKSLVLECLLR